MNLCGTDRIGSDGDTSAVLVRRETADLSGTGSDCDTRANQWHCGGNRLLEEQVWIPPLREVPHQNESCPPRLEELVQKNSTS